MKPLCVITCLLLTHLATFAQISIANTSLTDTTLNILYIGGDNIIAVKGANAKATVKLVSAKGQVSNIAPNRFNVTPATDRTDTLTVYIAEKKVLQEVFDVKRVSSPVAMLGTITDSSATIKQILTAPLVNIDLPGCYYKFQAYVFKFNAVLINKSGAVIYNANDIDGNQLPVELRVAISKAKSGDKLSLTKILMRSPSSDIRRVNDISITIR